MKNKNFLFCTAITGLVYLTMSLMFYTQLDRMYEFFNDRFVFIVADGWANLAQAAGMFTALLLIRRQPQIYGSKAVAAGVLAASFPLICLSVFTVDGVILFSAMLILNLLIGYLTAYYFSLIVAWVKPELALLSFAVAYTFGSFVAWIVSLLGDSIVAPRILPFYFVLIVTALIPILIYKNAVPEARSYDTPKPFAFLWDNRLLLSVIALMSAISMLGSADSSATGAGADISLLASRGLYGLGLLFMAVIYTKKRSAGLICVMASLVWPFLAIALFRENLLIIPACLLSYIMLGFFTVYRTGSLFDITAEQSLCPVFAISGLLISRAADAVTVFALTAFYENIYFFSRIAAAFLFIPLLILVFYMFSRDLSKHGESPKAELSESERRAAFAARYALTRREEEIAHYLAQSRSNGEIAEILMLSENTVRFHVSNILKKTGLHDRNEVSRAYHTNIDE